MADDEIKPAQYCSNCKKQPVCKYTTLIQQFDVTVANFNKVNMGMPTRISISSNNYNCKHKDPI